MKPAVLTWPDSRAGVLVLHQRYGVGAAAAFCPESEAGVLDQVNAVVEALDRCGIPARRAAVARIAEAIDALTTASEHVVFNLVESFPSGQDAHVIPSLCAAFGKGVTGADTACLALTQNKWRTNALLQGVGVPVPASLLVMPGETIDPEKLPPPPYIVKPVATDASEGLEAIMPPKDGGGAAKLSAAVAAVHRQFNQGALIETLVGQREINVSIFQDERGLRVMPLAEIDFSAFPASTPRVVDYDAKWKSDSFAFHHTPRIIPAPLPNDIADRIRQISRAAYRACGCQCYARVDLRLDDAGGIHALEINANPDLSPDAGFTAALAAGGVTFDAFVATVIRRALSTVTPGKQSLSSGDRPSDIISPARAAR